LKKEKLIVLYITNGKVCQSLPEAPSSQAVSSNEHKTFTKLTKPTNLKFNPTQFFKKEKEVDQT
jgi:hypothetical protein